MKRAAWLTVLALTALMAAAPARATVVSSLPDGVVVPIPPASDTFGFGTGPVSFGPGITWTSTTANSVFGYDNPFGYGFGSNGFWNQLMLPMAGLNDAAGTMTFAFDMPVAGVGGFVNYSPDFGNATLAIYDGGLNLLDSVSLTFLIADQFNGGEFVGFLLDTPEIRYFTVSDAYVGITQLTVQDMVSAAPVPEPATLLLVGAGIAGLATRKRRA